MIQTIKDLRIRHVFNPLPKVVERKSYMVGYNAGKNDGWNECMSYLKAAGKI